MLPPPIPTKPKSNNSINNRPLNQGASAPQFPVALWGAGFLTYVLLWFRHAFPAGPPWAPPWLPSMISLRLFR